MQRLILFLGIFVASGCSVKQAPIDVCTAVKILGDEPLKDIVISGKYVTDGRHSAFMTGTECRGVVIAPFIRRSNQGSGFDAVGAEEFMEHVFGHILSGRYIDYRVVVKGTLFPADKATGDKRFIISEVMDYSDLAAPENRTQGSENNRKPTH